MSTTLVDEKTPLQSINPPQGIYVRASNTSLRSPCPMVNALANHGYLPRSGRNVHRNDFSTAMNKVGLSTVLGALLSNPIFLTHQNTTEPSPSVLTKLWTAIKTRNMWELLPHHIGMWPIGQTDAIGEKYLNLDQLALHNAIEHDVSLSRRDFAQGDNLTPQKDLVSEILAASSDGGQTLTMSDLAALRRRRIETQRRENKELIYGGLEHELGCGEISLILNVLGDGERVRCDFVRAFFEQERLPVEEGWEPRKWWWTLGIVELKMTVNKVKGLIGMDI